LLAHATRWRGSATPTVNGVRVARLNGLPFAHGPKSQNNDNCSSTGSDECTENGPDSGPGRSVTRRLEIGEGITDCTAGRTGENNRNKRKYPRPDGRERGLSGGGAN
jgi:hypothetical protein